MECLNSHVLVQPWGSWRNFLCIHKSIVVVDVGSLSQQQDLCSSLVFGRWKLECCGWWPLGESINQLVHIQVAKTSQTPTTHKLGYIHKICLKTCDMRMLIWMANDFSGLVNSYWAWLQWTWSLDGKFYCLQPRGKHIAHTHKSTVNFFCFFLCKYIHYQKSEIWCFVFSLTTLKACEGCALKYFISIARTWYPLEKKSFWANIYMTSCFSMNWMQLYNPDLVRPGNFQTS